LKLDSWEIEQTLRAADYSTAVALVAKNFGISVPDNCCTTLYTDNHYIPEVFIDFGNEAFGWAQGPGFYREAYPTIHPVEPTVAIFYYGR